MAAGEIHTRRVSDVVHERLRQEILGGRLEPGAAVPSERVLSEQLGVNRHAVREALKRLEQAGLVQISQGGPTRVLDWRERGGLEVLLDLIDDPGGLRPGELRPGKLRPGELRPGELRPGELRPGELRPGELRPGELRPGELRPGELRPGELRPGELPPEELLRAVLELRACIGADAARRCAVRAPADARERIAALAAATAAARTPGGAGDESALAAYDELWRAIVVGAGNLAYRLALNSLLAALASFPRLAIALLPDDAGGLHALGDALAAGDPAAAEAAARTLLEADEPPA